MMHLLRALPLFGSHIPIGDWYIPPPEPSRRARVELQQKDGGHWAYPKPIALRALPEDRLHTRRSPQNLRFKGSRSLRRSVRQA